jgi:hypothetical protein
MVFPSGLDRRSDYLEVIAAPIDPGEGALTGKVVAGFVFSQLDFSGACEPEPPGPKCRPAPDTDYSRRPRTHQPALP